MHRDLDLEKKMKQKIAMKMMDLAPEEVTVVHVQAADVVAKLVGPASVIGQVEERKKQRKVGGQGPRRTVRVETKVIRVDDGSSMREEGVDLQRVEVESKALGGGAILVELEVQTGVKGPQMPLLS
ncbi:uncharacterized protein A4U43_C07F26160 [Asparagus officinalis]|uniref:Uncharacterized protein n=1 Tax=Asparagus officinalis TaxID=4686 RepID=A0A5P1EF36_ASPOF|nr:uncharacterized protein A4U43_C07F26160 [Asparagus officinalis]